MLTQNGIRMVKYSVLCDGRVVRILREIVKKNLDVQNWRRIILKSIHINIY